jgi:ubiquitin C-terminal hydrolase
LGNTCFLNAAVQSLRYCPELVAYFHRDEYKQHLKADRKMGPLVEETADVFKGMWRDDVRVRASMTPRGFVGTAARLCQDSAYDTLVSGGQQDSSEFLAFLLEAIHAGVARTVKMEIVGQARSKFDEVHIKSLESWASFYNKEFSPIVDNFFGQTMTTTTCNSCKAKSTRFEPWMMLKVPVPASGATTLDECISKAFETETLYDYACDGCKTKGQATLEHAISRLPPHLIIVMKRFENSGNKLRNTVAFNPDNVNLLRWVGFPGVMRNAKPTYSSYAMIEHHGCSRGGHYISYAKHNNQWLCYDDNSVSPTSTDSIVNNDTYVVLLTRKEYSNPSLFSKDKNE